MPQRPNTKQSAPAETLSGFNQGINLYTDPSMTNWKMWANASQVFSGPFGFVQRARFANVITTAETGSPSFTTLKFFAIPGLSNYLLGDINGKLFSFDEGTNYSFVQRINAYVDPTGVNPGGVMSGPWSREVLQNIVYEMNGQVKQAGRTANALIVEGWGLDTPDSSPQVALMAGTSFNLTQIFRGFGGVNARISGNFVSMFSVGSNVNVSGVSDPSFNGTFTLTAVNYNSGLNVTIFNWDQAGLDTSPITNSGTIDTGNVTKAVGRSYAWAWENANKFHVGAPSPSTQFVAYNNQTGTVSMIEVGTVAMSGTTTVTGTGTAFSAAWVGRNLYVDSVGASGRIVSVQSNTQLTLDTSHTFTGKNFQVYDFQATHVRIYATADGGATYFRIARNAFNPGAVALANAGLTYVDTSNAEPPNFPFTTETSQLFNIPPPIGAFVKEYQGRLLIYGIPGVNQTFFYTNQELTNIGQPQESCAPLNQITLPIQNASINGMVELPGSLIIWSDRQDMFRLTGLLSDNSGTGAATGTQQGSQIASLPYNLGCASPYAVALTPLGAIWLTPNAEVWLFTDKYAPRNVGQPIQSLLKNITPGQLSSARMAYYHTNNRNWVALAVAVNGSTTNNKLLLLDLDLLASNGSPSFFIFDMATNQAVWYPFDVACSALETMYESNLVRLFAGGVNVVNDVDFQGGVGTELAVPGGTITMHAWGNDTPFVVKRPSFIRFNTNRDPSLLATDGWSFGVNAIDDDFYTFDQPLTLGLVPGVNDTSTLCGNPALASGEAFRHSPELYRIGGVNFTAGRRLQFVVNFPSAAGVEYRLRMIQVGASPSPPF